MTDLPNFENQDRLNALFREYREICEPASLSPNFMPNLWERIESRQRIALFFRRVSGVFVTTALALSCAIGVYIALPGSHSAYYNSSYVEVLAAEDASDHVGFAEPVQVDVEAPVVHLDQI